MVRLIMSLWNKKYEPCKSCEILKEQLDIANLEKKELLSQILDITRPVVAEKNDINIKEIEPIRPKGIPWRVRQAKLEAESRSLARIKQEHEDDLRKLEEEVGVKEDASEISSSI